MATYIGASYDGEINENLHYSGPANKTGLILMILWSDGIEHKVLVWLRAEQIIIGAHASNLREISK